MRLTKAQARRIALAAQGMGQTRDGVVTMRQVQSTITRLGQFQIDTVNVVARAHYMPLFTRLGAYDRALLDRAASQPPRRLFEFWGHAASLIDVDLYPFFQFRRDNAYSLTWGEIRRFVDSKPQIIEQVKDAVRQLGPVTPRELNFGQDRKTEQWGWNWSDAKAALEWLYWSGDIAVAGRNTQFEKIYDIPERVIPHEHLGTHVPATHENHVELVRRAGRALGVGTATCLGDYFRTASAPTKAAISELVDTGELIEVEVEGLKDPAYLFAEVKRPRTLTASALVSPFDSLAFDRNRLSWLFDIDYKISIYTPAAQRTHGYYVYLFLLDDQFVARTDLKADRANSTLLVQSAYLEPHAEPMRTRVAQELHQEYARLAEWLGLTTITIVGGGDLAPDLAKK
jgi:uncharacterized protein YcaQ